MEEPLGLKFRPKTAGPSPELKANVLSYTTWQWCQPLVNLGNKKPLQKEDLHDMVPRESVDFNEKLWNNIREKQMKKGKKPTVKGIVYEACGRELLYSFVWMPIWFGAVLAQVYTMRAVVEEAQKGGSIEWWRGFLLVFSMWATSVVQSLGQHWSFMYGQKLGIRLKAAVNMVIFNKIMKMKLVALGGTSSGLMLNLVTNDTQKLVDAATFVAYAFFSIVVCVVVAILAIVAAGLAALPGVAVILLAQPLQVVIARVIGKIRRHAVKLTDSRVRTVAEILSGVRVVKYNGWTSTFLKRIDEIRCIEISWIRKATFLRACTTSFKDVISPIAALATFGTYVAINDGILVASEAFTLLGLFGILVRIYSIVPPSVQYISETAVGLQRMQMLMDLPDGSGPSSPQDIEKLRKLYPEAAVVVKEGTFSWYVREKDFEGAAEAVSNGVDEKMDEKSNLQDISLAVKKGELVAVIGSVGSGKSSLLLAVLGEMESIKGAFWTERNVSYVPQQPWILNDNVRNNIITTSDFDEARYKRVVFSCALEHDIAQLPAGDETEIGERGVNLSGGQKARISLARACYSQCPVVLLDDPLAAVDVPTARHLMQHVLGGIFKGRTVILVTHNKSSLEHVDRIFMMENGRLQQVNSKEDLDEKGLVSEEEEEDSDYDSSDGLEEEDGEQAKIRQPSSDGQNPSQDQLNTHLRTPSVNDAEKRTSFYSLEKSSSRTSKRSSFSKRLSLDEKGKQQGGDLQQVGGLTVKEDRMVGEVTWNTYFGYVRGGGVTIFTVTIFLMCLAQAVRVSVDYWVSAWVSDKYHKSTHIYLLSFAVLVVGAVILSIGRGLLFSEMAMRAASHMHREMAEKVLRSPQLFFDQNPVGRILNRFSKDQAMVDELLPYTAQGMFENLIGVLGVMVFIAIIMPWFLLCLPPFILLFIYCQQRYVAVSRELKRLDGLSRSPIYAHFAQTLQGLTSVRAYGIEAAMHDHFRDLIDANHRAMISFLHLSRWLGTRLDFTAAICVATTALLAVLLRNVISPGLVGVVLLESLQLTGFFQYGVRLVADTENIFTSVERIQTYGNLPTEAKSDSPPGLITEQWPEKGEIEFIKYTMAYRVDLPAVLNGLTFKVFPEEKIGILGRTGAGKSSLAAALFRMVENANCSGSILIDGVDLKDVGLDDLRLRLSIIPQDPVLFKGTLRFNLDPFERHRDDELHEALARVQLTTKIKSLDGGLSSEISENGENFSVGQRQLLCLARSLLRKSRIIVMDEATAAVDGETDQLIQETMRDVFSACTVLTIAHRIDTIIDCDRVLVLAKGGRISEFDSPLNLLKRAEHVDFSVNSTTRIDHVFANMVAQAGPTVARQLRRAAEAADEKKRLRRNEHQIS
ncbi:hypothetical protein R1flu_011880 [Riccia fluitans]|uniref:Uncharacterized protein n=1 Tax=Riccia fluitans TaxID=41844 RepID=A0ABD1Z910_9MARC